MSADRERGRSRLVYILAASHSGSTLLAMLLGSHPEIATVGELKFNALGDANLYRCSCRKEIRRCSYWHELGRAMACRGFEFDPCDARTDFGVSSSRYARRLLRPLHRGALLEFVRDAGLHLSATWKKEYDRIQARNGALVDSIAEVSGKNIVVDSSKVAVRLKFLLRNPRLDIRVIRLVRDGRAVALTYTDSAQFADAAEREFRGGGMGILGDYPRMTMSEAARAWRRSNEEAEALLRRLDGSRWMEVRYETLCTQTRATLDKIFAFLEVPPADALSLYRTTVQHVVGNGMRLDANREVRLDERWKTVLTRRDLEVFESVAGSLNRRLGYA